MTTPALHDVATFLARHPPFDAFETDRLHRLADAIDVEYFAAGTVIMRQGSPPRSWFWVVRTGIVELVDDGAVIDELEEGQLFGHPSMLAGEPASLEVRARTDVLCYRVAAEVARPLLSAPAGIRYVTRSLSERATLSRPPTAEPQRLVGFPAGPVRDLLRGPALLCRPDVTIREAADTMTKEGKSSIVVQLGRDVGVLTDRDLREHVICGDVSTDDPVTAVVHCPAHSVAPEHPAADLLLDMLDRGIRHVPVVDGARVVGVVRPTDLLGLDLRGLFFVRAAVARATTAADVAHAAASMPAAVVALHEAGLGARAISVMLAAVVDAIVRRLMQLVAGQQQVALTWITSGSVGRRESFPASDLDCGLIWPDGAGPDDALLAAGADLVLALGACGLREDDRGVVASNPLVARSAGSWRGLVQWIIDDPASPKAAIVSALVLDARTLQDSDEARVLEALAADVRGSERMQQLLAAEALTHRPPRGFVRDAVVGHRGRLSRRFDVKKAGLQPIVDLARWAGTTAGAAASGTQDRLRAAEQAGVLTGSDAATLCEAFDLLCEIRMEHHVHSLRRGAAADDLVDLGEVNPLVRSYLRDAFRAVAAVQRHVSGLLGFR